MHRISAIIVAALVPSAALSVTPALAQSTFSGHQLRWFTTPLAVPVPLGSALMFS
jgi:hypothetical protein